MTFVIIEKTNQISSKRNKPTKLDETNQRRKDKNSVGFSILSQPI